MGINITKHNRSALFDELGAAAGAGDLDTAPAPGHAQLLAALGAAVVVVELAVGPLILQAAELTVYAVLQGIVLVVLLRALGNVAAERSVIAEHQQYQPSQVNRLMRVSREMSSGTMDAMLKNWFRPSVP